jgi:hypothetical protein
VKLKIRQAAFLFILSWGYSKAPVHAASYGSAVDFNSRYIWRGIPLSKGGVLQPSAWTSAKGFTFQAWSNWVLAREQNQHRFDEVDFTGSYKKTWKTLDIEPSLVSYLFPNQDDEPDTAETALKLTYPVGPIALFTNQHVDIAAHLRAYFGEAGFDWKHEFSSRFSIDLPFSLGWASARFNEANLNVSKTALNVASGTLALQWSLTPRLTFSPHVDFSVLLDRDLRGANVEATFVTGGCSISWEL